MGEKLTGHDYMVTPLPELVYHPDFNQKAMSIIIDVSQMTTEELVLIELPKGEPNGR